MAALLVLVAAALAWFGAGCSSTAMTPPSPGGIARLAADLQALDQQQLVDPSCASQNPAPP